MPFVDRGPLRYFQFSIFDPQVLTQGIFTRHGGVSPPPWQSLNIGGTVGDEPSRVRENKYRLLDAMDCPPDSLFEVWQVHRAKVIVAGQSNPNPPQLPQADGVVTDNPDVTLLLRFADCVPIYLYDPDHHAIGLAHAGWKGTLKEIASHTVQAMVTHFGTRPGHIQAGLGPSIGPDHYEIGEDVINRVKQVFPKQQANFLKNEGDAVKLDLWDANRHSLVKSGVRSIEVSKICTACHNQDWYSHRAEKGKTGRFGALFSLR